MQQADVLMHFNMLVKVWRPAAWLLIMTPDQLREQLLNAVSTLQNPVSSPEEKQRAAAQLKNFITEII